MILLNYKEYLFDFQVKYFQNVQVGFNPSHIKGNRSATMALAGDKDHDHQFKLLIVGNSSVGKSAILLRFADDKYDESYVSTIGIDFKVRSIDIDGTRVKMQIWDTAGQEKFRTIGTAYYRNTHGVILVYDVTSKESFLSMERWLQEIKKNCGNTSYKIVLVGNKDDNPNLKKISTDEASEFAKQMGIPLFETSAKENINVEEMFYAIAKMMVDTKNTKTLARQKEKEIDNDTKRVRENKSNNKRKGKKSSSKCIIL